MKYFDVFNGDADGICALHQLRLAEPRAAELISGVKREINLLHQIREVRAAEITVLDISLASNRADLEKLLGQSNRVLYIDHHFAGEPPVAANLTTHLDPAGDTCTGLIVDRLLAGKYRPWAVVAAFGDNLHEAARQAAAPLGLPEEGLARLREIGELLNYNGYGKSVEDLHFSPPALYRAVQPFADPLLFYENSEVLARLQEGFRDDMARARLTEPVEESKIGRIFQWPAEAWARRAAGVFINEKARERPGQAHALVIDNGDHTFLVSVRAPLHRKQGADVLCRLFPTGGGRAAAAGVNELPVDQLASFRQSFQETFAL